jgi:phosphoserine phosphatase
MTFHRESSTGVRDSSRTEVCLCLIGVDTAETVHPQKPVEYFGAEASAFAERDRDSGHEAEAEAKQLRPRKRDVRPYDLVAFDVDGTLVQAPNGWTVWEVLNERFTGTAESNRERYAQYLAGKLSYADWVALDVRGWRDAGAGREELVRAFEPLRLVPGVREGLAELRRRGLRLFAISGTLDLMLQTLYPDHPFEEVYANHIGFDDQGRISHWRATPFDMDGKAKALRAVALREGIPLARCAFVGDSGNDVWIAREAGRTVAFNPRSAELERIAHVSVRAADFRAVLPHLLGAEA